MDAFIDFTGGTLGGVANVYVGQPLDTVKVKMQAFPKLYRSSFHCAVKTFKVDGIYRGWYAGTVPALVANVSTNAALFFSYGLCQKAVARIVKKSDPRKLTPIEYGYAGSGAAVVAALVLCPAELVKCRLQAARELNKSTHVGPFSLTKQIFRETGFVGFYRGFSSLLVREIPGYFVFFGAYELSRELFTPAFKTKDQIGVVKTGISGGIGGMASWCLVFPADVVKSRIQIDSSSSAGKQSFISALNKIVKTEGISKLYFGLWPTLVRTFFSTGALFITVEETSKLMRKHLKDQN